MSPLKEMAQINIREVDANSLPDSAGVKMIDKSLPKAERIRKYIDEMRNPYCYRCGDVVVKIEFSDNSISLQNRIVNMIDRKMSDY